MATQKVTLQRGTTPTENLYGVQRVLRALIWFGLFFFLGIITVVLALLVSNFSMGFGMARVCKRHRGPDFACQPRNSRRSGRTRDKHDSLCLLTRQILHWTCYYRGRRNRPFGLGVCRHFQSTSDLDNTRNVAADLPRITLAHPDHYRSFNAYAGRQFWSIMSKCYWVKRRRRTKKMRIVSC